MSEFTGNRRELSEWLEELDEIYDDYVIKGQNGAPDTFDGHYILPLRRPLQKRAVSATIAACIGVQCHQENHILSCMIPLCAVCQHNFKTGIDTRSINSNS